jgi:hypothetical protein
LNQLGKFKQLAQNNNMGSSSNTSRGIRSSGISIGGMADGFKYKYRTPTKLIKCKNSKRIRALAFNPRRNEIAAISMNSAFHYFDVTRFEQVRV